MSKVCDMEKWRSLKVPRYTSYPAAPHFDPAIDGTVVAHWLENMPTASHGVKGLSLYLHIPYCREMCWFCGCFTKITKSDAVIEKYVRLLLKEIALVGGKVGKRNVAHVHFGGGSPSILSPQQFTDIMAAIDEHFTILPDAEVAVELDPRTVSEAKVAAYANAGVNRASIGIQDLDEKVQEAINRIQPYHVAHQTVSWLREYGIAQVNIDLVYGLPHQTVASVLQTAELALNLHPQRIALFGYAHVPWMKKHQRLIDESVLPDADARVAMLQQTAALLVEKGFDAIGFDHFALPDDELAIAQREKRLHRNFQGYTADEAEILIGLGISSIGHLPQGYVQNTSDIHAYEKAVNAGEVPSVRGFAMTEDDRMRAQLIEALMCNFEVDVAAVLTQHHRGAHVLDAEMARLKEMEAEGLVELGGMHVRMTQDAQALVRVVASVFDAYLERSAGRHSVAV
jgi:oxygen-independent coproporphyrinogen-3 oxidase